VATRASWRAWLAAHHRNEAGVWVVYFKKRSERRGVSYEESVEEALCFGWIDSLIRRIDDDRYARLFTPRKAGSQWSATNRRRWAKVVAEGRVTAAGRARAPEPASSATRERAPESLSPDLERALRRDRKAWSHFERLAPSHRRRYVGWIMTAKKPETRKRRLGEAMERLARGETLGLK